MAENTGSTAQAENTTEKSTWRCGARDCEGKHLHSYDRCSEGVWYCRAKGCPGHSKKTDHCYDTEKSITWDCGSVTCSGEHDHSDESCSNGTWQCNRVSPPCMGHPNNKEHCPDDDKADHDNWYWSCGSKFCNGHSNPYHQCPDKEYLEKSGNPDNKRAGVWKCNAVEPPCPGHSKKIHRCYSKDVKKWNCGAANCPGNHPNHNDVCATGLWFCNRVGCPGHTDRGDNCLDEFDPINVEMPIWHEYDREVLSRKGKFWEKDDYAGMEKEITLQKYPFPVFNGYDVKFPQDTFALEVDDQSNPKEYKPMPSMRNGYFQHIVWLGVCGYIVVNHYDKDIILLDPWASYHSYFTETTPTISPRPLHECTSKEGRNTIQRLQDLVNFLRLAKGDGYRVSAILMSHGHYDHIEDIPFIIEAMARPEGNYKMSDFFHLSWNNDDSDFHGIVLKGDPFEEDEWPTLVGDFDAIAYLKMQYYSVPRKYLISDTEGGDYVFETVKDSDGAPHSDHKYIFSFTTNMPSVEDLEKVEATPGYWFGKEAQLGHIGKIWLKPTYTRHHYGIKGNYCEGTEELQKVYENVKALSLDDIEKVFDLISDKQARAERFNSYESYMSLRYRDRLKDRFELESAIRRCVAIEMCHLDIAGAQATSYAWNKLLEMHGCNAISPQAAKGSTAARPAWYEIKQDKKRLFYEDAFVAAKVNGKSVYEKLLGKNNIPKPGTKIDPVELEHCSFNIDCYLWDHMNLTTSFGGRSGNISNISQGSGSGQRITAFLFWRKPNFGSITMQKTKKTFSVGSSGEMNEEFTIPAPLEVDKRVIIETDVLLQAFMGDHLPPSPLSPLADQDLAAIQENCRRYTYEYIVVKDFISLSHWDEFVRWVSLRKPEGEKESISKAFQLTLRDNVIAYWELMADLQKGYRRKYPDISRLSEKRINILFDKIPPEDIEKYVGKPSGIVDENGHHYYSSEQVKHAVDEFGKDWDVDPPVIDEENKTFLTGRKILTLGRLGSNPAARVEGYNPVQDYTKQPEEFEKVMPLSMYDLMKDIFTICGKEPPPIEKMKWVKEQNVS